MLQVKVALPDANAPTAADTATTSRIPRPPGRAPTGSLLVEAFDDGSGVYEDGLVYDPSRGKFRKPRVEAPVADPRASTPGAPPQTKAVRRVRTPEGSRLFHQPIGTPIHPDLNPPMPVLNRRKRTIALQRAQRANPPAPAAPSFGTISGRDLLTRALDRNTENPLTANEQTALGDLARVITPGDYSSHTVLLGNPTPARRARHTQGWVDLQRSVHNLQGAVADRSDARRVAAWLWNWHNDPKNNKLDVDNVDVSLPMHQVNPPSPVVPHRREYAPHKNVPITELQLDDRIDGETVVHIGRSDTGEYDVTVERPDGELAVSSYSEDSILDISSPVGAPRLGSDPNPPSGGIPDATMKTLRKRKAAAKFYAKRKHGMTKDQADAHAKQWWDHALKEVRAGNDVPHHMALLNAGKKTPKDAGGIPAKPAASVAPKPTTRGVNKVLDTAGVPRYERSHQSVDGSGQPMSVGGKTGFRSRRHKDGTVEVSVSQVGPGMGAYEKRRDQMVQALTDAGYTVTKSPHFAGWYVVSTEPPSKPSLVHEIRTYPTELEPGDKISTQMGVATVQHVSSGTGKPQITTDKGAVHTYGDVNRVIDVPTPTAKGPDTWTSATGDWDAFATAGPNNTWRIRAKYTRPSPYHMDEQSQPFPTRKAAHAAIPAYLAERDDSERRAERFRQKSRARVDAMTEEDLKRERASIEEQGRDMGGWHPQWLNESDIRALLREAEDPKWGNGYGTYGVPSYSEIAFSAPLLRSMLKLPPKKLTETKSLDDQLAEHEAFALELEEKVSRVRTAEGAHKYGLPIGSIIRRDAAGNVIRGEVSVGAGGFHEPRPKRPTVRERVAAQGAEADARIAEREKLALLNRARKRRGLPPLARLPERKTLEEKGVTVRHVRTPEGSRKYGAPIGSIIKLDVAGNVIERNGQRVAAAVHAPARVGPKDSTGRAWTGRAGRTPNVPNLDAPAPEVHVRRQALDAESGKLKPDAFLALPDDQKKAILGELKKRAGRDTEFNDRSGSSEVSRAQLAYDRLRKAKPRDEVHVPRVLERRPDGSAMVEGRAAPVPAEELLFLRERGAVVDDDPNPPAGASGGYGLTKTAMRQRGDGDTPMAADKFPKGDPRNDPEYAAYVTQLEKTLQEALDAGLDTETLHTHVDPQTGARVYSAARTREHVRILDQIMADADMVPSERKAVMMGGISGAGKSTFLKTHGERLGLEIDDDGNPTNAVVINPDELKSALLNGTDVDGNPLVDPYPGLRKGEMAELTHEESSYLANLLAERALNQGKNVVFDITLGDGEKARRKYLENDRGTGAKDLGYSVQMAFVDGDIATSLHRAGLRHKQPNPQTGERGYSGRFVRYEHVASQALRDEKLRTLDGKKPRSQNRVEYDGLVRSGLFDSALRYDNVTGEFMTDHDKTLAERAVAGAGSPSSADYGSTANFDEDAVARQLFDLVDAFGNGGEKDVSYQIVDAFRRGNADDLDDMDRGRLRIALQRSGQDEALAQLLDRYGDDFGRGVDPEWDNEFTKPKAASGTKALFDDLIGEYDAFKTEVTE